MLRFIAGEESCFIELVKTHKQRVFAFAYRFLGNAADAEDAAQEVFIKVYNARAKYTVKAKFTTWLFTITRNTCLNFLAKRGNKGLFVPLDENPETQDDAPGLQLADPKDLPPAELLIRKEQAEAVKKALASLPENQRTAVLLCRYDELSYEAIAEVMGCSAKAVKSILHRAKLGLKEKLAELFQ
ncbi:MAG: RNA polymerase sigma factor [Elusimicrobiota bacterium]